MVEKKVTVNLETGLQARPAAKFVQEANRFSSEVFLEKGNKRVNAKSIMGVMSLAIGTNEDVTLQAEGADEEQAINTLASLMETEE
ncbi:catabolite repression HPr-like protein [Alkalibacillus filiformis]|uniref:Catabolite repression HPr-like protein n=1 Tax=Alkalibacillus filiformis TaxID=200990 RepID=A0ABU0DVP5_9BACI|nr:HPr family phosphocarrier protein [Alkalibacillus filiformis]MDQ0352533.1 catabolite repression HPr-like protein [Alkalibacillus filiformis]